MTRTAARLVFVIAAMTAAASVTAPAQAGRKMLIAHRGASAYAPEHTLRAYRLAIEQGADFVEQDLQITKDGVLVCLHDTTLERTTNVEEVFPNRAVEQNGRKTWPVSEFTLAELKQLDAGRWFAPDGPAETIPTFQEAIDLIKGKAGLYPEMKAPSVYGKLGFQMDTLLLEALAKNGLAEPGADPTTPVIIQSFSHEALLALRKAGTKLPLVLLVSDGDKEAREKWLSDAGLKAAAVFADGIGPAKSILLDDPTLTERAHALGLTVTPYTFRAPAKADPAELRKEMADFLYGIGVDALFTDNPDRFPRK